MSFINVTRVLSKQQALADGAVHPSIEGLLDGEARLKEAQIVEVLSPLIVCLLVPLNHCVL
jgi:hypothetical protein